MILLKFFTSLGKKLTSDGLLKHFQEYYRDKYYPHLLLNNKIPDRDKAYIKSLMTKPWNLYIFRHPALTEKSKVGHRFIIQTLFFFFYLGMPRYIFIYHIDKLKRLLHKRTC
jgi:hypothetical protein